jgi:hypothetical protein
MQLIARQFRCGLTAADGGTALLAPLGLHTGQEALLLELARTGPMISAQLSEALGCEPPSVTLMTSKLEAAGHLRRKWLADCEWLDVRNHHLTLVHAGAMALLANDLETALDLGPVAHPA